jgi:hypothetical protein
LEQLPRLGPSRLIEGYAVYQTLPKITFVTNSDLPFCIPRNLFNPSYSSGLFKIEKKCLFLDQSDCSEMFRPPSVGDNTVKKPSACSPKNEANIQGIISTLHSAFPEKHGEAADITSLTLKTLKARAKPM